MNLDPMKQKEGHEFSENQKNLWKVCMDNPEIFNNQIVLELGEGISTLQIKKTIGLILQKQKLLSFNIDINKKYLFPIQYGSNKTEIDYHEVEMKGVDTKFLIDKVLDYKFDPSLDAAIRFCGVRSNGKIKYLGIRLYALWGDAHSVLTIVHELSRALRIGKLYLEEEQKDIDYVNYASWQNELLDNPEENAMIFWKTYNHQIVNKIVPFIVHSERQSFSPARRLISVIDANQYSDILEYCAEKGCSVGDLFLLNWTGYLFSFTTNPITLGFIPFGRFYEELNNTIGFIDKAIPVCIDKPTVSSKEENIQEIRNKVAQVRNWEDYFSLSREDILKDEATKIFNYCFEFIDFNVKNSLDPFLIKDVYTVQDPFKLKLSCIDYGNRVEVELYYDEETIGENELKVIEAQLLDNLKNLSNADQGINRPSTYEKEIFALANKTEKKVKEKSSVIKLFEKSARKYPNNIAISQNNSEPISYRELNIKANQFASYLQQEFKVKRGEPIGILLEPSEWVVISVLGILKTGAYYVPIDKNYPVERVNFILKDCGCKVLVCNNEFSKEDAPPNINILIASNTDNYNTSIEAPIEFANYDTIAYCIYTSGSSGNPKGCLVNHASLLNYVNWANEYYFDKGADSGNWGLITSISFDLTITSLFSSLTRGKKLWIAGEAENITELLVQSFSCPEIDTLKLTPSHILLLKELDIYETNIKVIICGGEQLKKAHVDIIKSINPKIRVFNEYGPTETTVGCIAKEVFIEDEVILIGKPISNTKVNILDQNDNRCAIGVVGEISISGSGLANGYLNRGELTSEKFVADPFDKSKLMYRTGDLGRWFPNGNIEFIGRKDGQVKIKGHRIELAEIEAKLLLNKSITQATVLVREADLNERELVGYIVANKTLNTLLIHEHLANELPDFMIPNHFIQLDKIPLTINGKIDKDYLYDLQNEKIAIGIEYLAPANNIEQALAAIWQNELSLEKVGVNDVFFQLGGDSIKGVRIVAEIQKRFNIRMNIAVLFQNPSIKALALVVSDRIEQHREVPEGKIIDKTII